MGHEGFRMKQFPPFLDRPQNFPVPQAALIGAREMTAAYYSPTPIQPGVYQQHWADFANPLYLENEKVPVEYGVAIGRSNSYHQGSLFNDSSSRASGY